MDYYRNFINTSAEKLTDEFRSQNDDHWKEIGEKMALQLFREASNRVPAYSSFLKKHKVVSKDINTISDFKKLPLIDKETYINKYKLNELCWDGKLENSYFLSSSSGSTGIPNFWPRSPEQTMQGALISEVIYKDFFGADKKSTLYVLAFAMGMWIAGTYMMMSTEWVAQKGYPITIAAPGLNRDEIVRLVRMGEEYFDQVVVVGYPPFVKDVIDFGIEKGVDWKKINLKFLFTGEAFTERWRAHLQSVTSLKNTLTDAINMYGSADIGLIAHETPLTNYLRSLAVNDPLLTKELFGAERVPSINQFNPHIRYFEKEGEELVVTAPSGIPLVRYNTKDIGDILYFEELQTKLHDQGIDIFKEAKNKKIDNLVWRTPIVYLFGRGKFSASIYGITIFPEYVKFILDNKILTSLVTGKYVISTEETETHDQSLHLRVELKDGVVPSADIVETLKNVFIDELPKISSEYRHLLGSMGEKVYPAIQLYEYGDPEYFARGVIKKGA